MLGLESVVLLAVDTSAGCENWFSGETVLRKEGVACGSPPEKSNWGHSSKNALSNRGGQR